MRLLFALALAASLPAQPVYSEESVVNAATGQRGRFSPNTQATIYGAGLTSPILDTYVVVMGTQAQVLYRSSGQVNFVFPPGLVGRLQLWLVVGNVLGPRIWIDIQEESPELYAFPGDFAAATHADGRIVTPEAPALPGQIAVLYGTGFGRVHGNLSAGPRNTLVTPLDIWLDGRPVPRSNVLYQGFSPAVAGLYQINLVLPDDLGPDPLIQLGVRAEPSSRTGLRLLVRPTAP